jgi:hypothetical protein
MIVFALALAQSTASDETIQSAKAAYLASLSSCRVQALGSSPISAPVMDNHESWRQHLAIALKIAKQNLEQAETEEAKVAYRQQVDVAEKCLAQGSGVTAPAQGAHDKHEQAKEPATP